MRTKIISFFALVFMISTSSFAEGDGEKGLVSKEKAKMEITEKTIATPNNLIVINLNESEASNGLPEDILKQFDEVMAYPKEVKDAADEECVLVGFTYDDDGYINVVDSKTSHEAFRKHVISNIEKIRLRDGSVTIGKQYFAKFSFKKL
jgi:hypothetical protein